VADIDGHPAVLSNPVQHSELSQQSL